MSNYTYSITTDLAQGIGVRELPGVNFTGDISPVTLEISVMNGQSEVTITGQSVTAYCILPDARTVTWMGSASGNVATVTMSAACFDLKGRISLMVKLSDGSVVTTIYAGVGSVVQSNGSTVVTPTQGVPTIETLMADVATATAAADAATVSATAAAADATAAASTAAAAQPQIEHLNEELFIPKDTSGLAYANGGISSSTGANANNSAHVRVTSYVQCKAGSVIGLDDYTNYRYAVYFYSSPSVDDFIEAYTFTPTAGHPTTVPYDCYVRFSIRKEPSATVTDTTIAEHFQLTIYDGTSTIDNFSDQVDRVFTASGEESFLRYFPEDCAIGGLNVTTGATSSSTIFARTSFIPVGAGTVVSCDPGYVFQVCYYKGNHVNDFVSGRSASAENYEVPGDGWLRLSVRSDPSSTVTDVSILEHLKASVFPLKKTHYRRDFTDATPGLVFQNLAISGNALVESSADLMAELPGVGCVEVRMNSPAYAFEVYSYNGSAYTRLSQESYHYQYRFFASPSLTYYVHVVKQDSSAIVPANGPTGVKVFEFDDEGVREAPAYFDNGTLAVIGDSIVQGRYPKMSSSVNCTMARPFYVILGEYANDPNPGGYGIGGATVTNIDWKSLYLNCTNVSGYATVIVAAGTNDYGANVTAANFQAAYEYVVDTLVANNTRVVLCTPTWRTTTSANSAGLTPQDYADIIKDIAETKGLHLIDLYSLTNVQAYRRQLVDGLHPDEVGQKIIADIIVENWKLPTT